MARLPTRKERSMWEYLVVASHTGENERIDMFEIVYTRYYKQERKDEYELVWLCRVEESTS